MQGAHVWTWRAVLAICPMRPSGASTCGERVGGDWRTASPLTTRLFLATSTTHTRNIVKMSAEDDQTQYDELAGGPGAPTPLTQLEVSNLARQKKEGKLTCSHRALQASRSATYNCS